MKKTWFVVLAVLAALAITSGVALAGGENRIAILGGNVDMQVQSPFRVSGGETGSTLSFKTGQVTNIYPGQEIADNELTITNVAPLPLAVGFDSVPYNIAVASDWPAFDTIFIINGVQYRSGEYIIPAGANVTGRVKISVAYWAQPSAPFQGIDLNIFPLEPQPERG